MEQKDKVKIERTIRVKTDRKRKFLWDVITQPLKSSRVDREERRPIEVTKGYFSLKDIRGAKFPGCQTAATSLCAILQSKALCPSSWSTEVIDKVLLQGDKLHSMRAVRLGKEIIGKHAHLSAEELPKNFCIIHEQYDLEYEKVVQNVTNGDTLSPRTNPRRSRVMQLLKVLKPILGASHGGVLLRTRQETIALLSDNTYCYLFHPCKQSTSILSSNDHEAVLCKFRDVEHLSTYFCDKFIKDKSDTSVHVVEITASFSRKLSWV